MAISSSPIHEAEEDENSDGDSDSDEDMEALRKACLLTGTNPNDLQSRTTCTTNTSSSNDSDSDSSVDDFELARSIQERFSVEEPLNLEPLSIRLPSSSDDDEDDFETLRAIQARFSNHESNTLENTESHLNKLHSVYGNNIAPKPESFRNLSLNINCAETGSEDACNTLQPLDSSGNASPQDRPFGFIECHQSEASGCSYPKPAHLLMDAIKKNRLYQKTLQSKLIDIEAMIEENRKLKERIKLLNGFQVSFKRRTERVLSQKKDARVQLISLPRSRKSLISKVNDKKLPSLLGPVENSHVANYRMVLEKFSFSLRRERWSKAEGENLRKGIRQQFLEMFIQKPMELYSGSQESVFNSNVFDTAIPPIKHFEIKPEDLRAFLPKVNWEQLASMYVVRRSGAECQTRWLNKEDPLINSVEWTKTEDKKLLYIIQQRGIYNWVDIAIALGTNRTPCQCFTRFQRSLNAHIMKRDWTEDEDARLLVAVEAFGENNWQSIASSLEGRTGPQCSNRWKFTLNPAREKVGRWTVEEDKHLKVAVMLFGPRTWNKIAQFVPGRTQAQCRERWLNVLDPSLNLEPWTEQEDSRLKAAIAEYGHCWSKVATCVHPRTDNQCRRRWKVLLPHEVPVLQQNRRILRAALISNFVDREKERPKLGASDFLLPEAESGISVTKKKKIRKPNSKKQKVVASRDGDPQKIGSKRSRVEPEIGVGGGSESFDEDDGILKKKIVHRARSKSNRCPQPAMCNQEVPFSPQPSDSSDETFCEKNAASKKKKLRKRCRIPALSLQKLQLSPESSKISRAVNIDDDDETFQGDGLKKNKKRKRVLEQHLVESNGSTGPDDQVVGSAETTDEDNVTLASFFRKKVKKRKNLNAKDDATLACIFRNKVKKKRALNANKDDQAG